MMFYSVDASCRIWRSNWLHLGSLYASIDRFSGKFLAATFTCGDSGRFDLFGLHPVVSFILGNVNDIHLLLLFVLFLFFILFLVLLRNYLKLQSLNLKVFLPPCDFELLNQLL